MSGLPLGVSKRIGWGVTERTGCRGRKWNGRGLNGCTGRTLEQRYRGALCDFCLILHTAQRPTTACRSGHVVAGPRGIRMCATFPLTLYCDAIQTPRGQECKLCTSRQSLHSARYGSRQGRGLAHAHRGFLCVRAPSCTGLLCCTTGKGHGISFAGCVTACVITLPSLPVSGRLWRYHSDTHKRQ